MSRAKGARQTRSAAPAAVAEPEAPPATSETYFGACEVLEFTRRTRSADPSAAADAEERVVYDITISTEKPVMTPWGEEVLGHGDGEVDLRDAGAGISWLLEHGGPGAPYRVDPDFHGGLVTEIKVVGKRLRGVVEFGSQPRAQVAEEDFAKGLRPFVSVGWLPGPDFKTVVTQRNGKPDLIRRTGWRPVEASSISVPADFTARKGRSGPGIDGFPVITEGDPPIREELKMKKVRSEGAVIEVAEDDPRPAITESPNGGGQRSVAEIQGDSNKRASQIVRLCRQFGVQDRAVEFIESGMSVPDVCDKIQEGQGGTQMRSTPAAERLEKPIVPGIDKKTGGRYSVLRAIRCAVTGKYDGLEGDLHNTIEKSLPSNYERRGERSILIPMRVAELTEEDMVTRQTRALGSGVSDGGATLVTNTQMEILDILRNATMCTRAGAQTIPGLVGTISFPKQTADPTVRRMQENPASAAAASNATYGWVLGSPKTYIGVDVIPRQLINLSSYDVEANERKSLVAAHGLALDLDGLYGLGSANEPLGVYPNTDTQSLAMGGATTYAKLMKMIGMAGEKNIPGSAISFMTTLLEAASLATTAKIGAVPPAVWDGRLDEGSIQGYPAFSTNQMSKVMTGRAKTGGAEHGLIAGAWENVKFLLWGALEVTVDGITLADKGQLKLVSFLMADVVNVRPEGFVVSTGVTVA